MIIIPTTSFAIVIKNIVVLYDLGVCIFFSLFFSFSLFNSLWAHALLGNVHLFLRTLYIYIFFYILFYIIFLFFLNHGCYKVVRVPSY